MYSKNIIKYILRSFGYKNKKKKEIILITLISLEYKEKIHNETFF